jgi:predicted enzyme related to lactoylglutathione lyase
MRVVQIAQHADDLDRASSWYERLVGAPPDATFDPPGLVFFVLDGVRLLLDRATPSALIYLEVPDVRERIAELRADGVRVTTEPHLIFRHDDDTLGPAGKEEWQAFIEDSEGNQVGLISYT